MQNMIYDSLGVNSLEVRIDVIFYIHKLWFNSIRVEYDTDTIHPNLCMTCISQIIYSWSNAMIRYNSGRVEIAKTIFTNLDLLTSIVVLTI